MKQTHGVLTVLGALSLTLLVLELGIRAVDMKGGKGFFSSDRNILKSAKPLVPFRTFGFDLYREKDGVRYISSRQETLYPFKKTPGTLRIVSFGGSTTEQAEEGMHYPLRLEALLRERVGRENIEVINLGFSAYSTPHFLILLELNVLSWEPDLVILSEVINDLSAAYFPGFSPDYSNKYRNSFYSVPDYLSRFTLANVLFQKSQLYWVIRSRVNQLTIQRERTEVRRESMGNEPLPEAKKVFERNLKSFVVLARANKIGVLLATQALEPEEEYFLREMAYKPYNNIVVYPLHQEFLKHHLSYNKVIEKTAREMNVWFLDNNADFGGKREYFIDAVHYTRKGIERLAENYAEFLIQNNIVR